MAVEKASNGEMSRLLGWEVWNFMSLGHARFDFDDRNIISLLGYNDSGKSNALRALDVNLTNRWAQAQLAFIQSGKDYFRVVTYWSDGITILKDKYINGQGLYEMYKDGEVIYTTKNNNSLTRIADTPECIKDYLNLVKIGDTYLNSRNCFEKQFLVQTSGSENYEALNIILRSEELSLAGSMLNVDRNKLAADISQDETVLNLKRSQYKASLWLSEELVDSMKSIDKLLDVIDEKLSSLGTIKSTSENLIQIPEIPKIPVIQTEQIELLLSVMSCGTSISGIPAIPQLEKIDTSRLDSLLGVLDCSSKLSTVKVPPQVPSIDSKRIDACATLMGIMGNLSANIEEERQLRTQIELLSAEMIDVESRIKDFGVKTVRCKNCNALVEVGGDDIAKQCC